MATREELDALLLEMEAEQKEQFSSLAPYLDGEGKAFWDKLWAVREACIPSGPQEQLLSTLLVQMVTIKQISQAYYDELNPPEEEEPNV